MNLSRETILTDLIQLLRKLADDWDYTGEITAETRFFADLGLQSVDVVVLGTAVQERYKTRLPFTELFARVGQRSLPDIPLGEWVDFIHENLQKAANANDATGRASK